MKFAKECPHLIDDSQLTRTEVDLIFTKAKPKFERRLDFEHFLDALAAISERKYPDYAPADGLRLLISNHLAPLYDFVKAEMQKTGESEIPLEGVFKKLYDPRSYTGVYAERFRSGDGRINGEADNRPGRQFLGSTNTATNEIIHDISVLMRPNLSGGGTMLAPANHMLYKRDPSMRSKSPTMSGIHGSPSRSNYSTLGSPRPRSAAASFASPQAQSRLAPTPAPTPSQSMASAGLDASSLSAALAKAQAGDMNELVGLSQKIAELVKAQAQENSNGASAKTPFASREDELNADIAHLQQEKSAASAAGDMSRLAEIEDAIQNRRSALNSNTAPRQQQQRSSTSASTPSHGTQSLNQENIKEMFEYYCNFGRSSVMSYQVSIDSFNFMKFARECPGLIDRDLNRTEVDLIFTKAKPKSERRLHFSHFLDALAAISERKYPDYAPADGLRLLISNHLAPLYDFVKAEMQKTGESEIPLEGVFKKLYDPRSYTGVYAERFRSGDGRINGEADNRPGRQFLGSTNTATNEIIHDISVLMRPNLRSGSMMTNRPGASGGSPKKAIQAAKSPMLRTSPGPQAY